MAKRTRLLRRIPGKLPLKLEIVREKRGGCCEHPPFPLVVSNNEAFWKNGKCKVPRSEIFFLFVFFCGIFELAFGQTVTIVGKEIIAKFMRKHPNSQPSLSAWLDDAESYGWKTLQDVKARYQAVDFLSGNQMLLDIGGNDFKLVVLVRYKNRILLIKKIGTHAEYLKWKLS